MLTRRSGMWELVTETLVAVFDLDEATKRVIRELVAKPPVAEGELRKRIANGANCNA
jgi:hypothetical protein